MSIQLEDRTLTPEVYAALIAIADLNLPELRDKVYDYVPYTLEELQKWTRGELVARLFDVWLKKNAPKSESDTAEHKQARCTSARTDPYMQYGE